MFAASNRSHVRGQLGLFEAPKQIHERQVTRGRRFNTSGREAAVSKQYAERYNELEQGITPYDVRDAFHALLATARYNIYPNRKKPAVNFRDGVLPRRDPIPYAFIVNSEWLLFYIREVAFESWQPFEHKLKERYDEFDPDQWKSNTPSTPQWTVKLACVDDVEFLYRLCPATPYPLVRCA